MTGHKIGLKPESKMYVVNGLPSIVTSTPVSVFLTPTSASAEALVVRIRMRNTTEAAIERMAAISHGKGKLAV
jgi:hypothetical protein